MNKVTGFLMVFPTCILVMVEVCISRTKLGQKTLNFNLRTKLKFGSFPGTPTEWAWCRGPVKIWILLIAHSVFWVSLGRNSTYHGTVEGLPSKFCSRCRFYRKRCRALLHRWGSRSHSLSILFRNHGTISILYQKLGNSCTNSLNLTQLGMWAPGKLQSGGFRSLFLPSSLRSMVAMQNAIIKVLEIWIFSRLIWYCSGWWWRHRYSPGPFHRGILSLWTPAQVPMTWWWRTFRTGTTQWWEINVPSISDSEMQSHYFFLLANICCHIWIAWIGKNSRSGCSVKGTAKLRVTVGNLNFVKSRRA